MQMSKTQESFTIVEIILIIGIIGVIVAIVIPNLMRAHIRSKVSLIKSEMTSIAMALENYKADYGTYPIEPESDPEGENLGPDEVANPDEIFGITKSGELNAIGLGRLAYPDKDVTEPVYMNRIPGDPFNDNGQEEWYVTEKGEFIGHHNNHYCYFTSGIQGEIKHWALVSYGPDEDQDVTSYNEARNAEESGNKKYDSTNGILSNGDIILIGP